MTNICLHPVVVQEFPHHGERPNGSPTLPPNRNKVILYFVGNTFLNDLCHTEIMLPFTALQTVHCIKNRTKNETPLALPSLKCIV